MSSLFLIAFIGGFLTIAAPCILAVLPIILGSTLGQKQSKLRPFFIVFGLTVSFTAFGVIFQYVTSLFGLSNNSLRNIALVFLAAFGLALIFPALTEKIIFSVQNFFNKFIPSKPGLIRGGEEQKKKGLINGFLVGASLGLVWVPCAGPILGAILTIAVTQKDIGKVTLLMLAYSLGAGLPMLLIAYGGNFIVTRMRIIKEKGMIIQQISGVFLLMGVAAIALGLDTKISTGVAGLFPDLNQIEQKLVDTSGINGPQPGSQQQTSFVNDTINNLLLPKGTPAPELAENQDWMNSPPVKLSDLKGKVVIIDFWTYSCINCIRTIPYLNTWYSTYKDKGLVIIGVHTPEFAFEKELSNVQKAVKDFGIEYPVVLDNNYATWNAYNNHYWPAKYIIDRDGNVRYVHFGEGKYDETEMIIQTLLGEQNGVKIGQISKVNAPAEDLEKINTPEIYLGYARGEYFGNTDRSGNALALNNNTVQNFAEPTAFENDKFYLAGEWKITGEYIVANKADAKLFMNYSANKLNIVVDKTDGDVTGELLMDGKPLPAEYRGKDVGADGKVIINRAALYNLVDTGSSYGRHTVTLEFSTPGVKVFTFTFG